MEGRAKVAYDPRDFENGGEGEDSPRLTIMEEILLLGLKDKAVSRPHIGSASGAMLTSV
jgi:Golgi phosphoprotein 3